MCVCFTFSGICWEWNDEEYGSYGVVDGLYCLDDETSGYSLECQISDFYAQVCTRVTPTLDISIYLCMYISNYRGGMKVRYENKKSTPDPSIVH